MSAFTTRSFLIADYAAVLSLWQAAEGVEIAEGDTRADIDAYLRRNPALSRIAELDGKIVGAVLCGHDGRRGLIYHLAVAPAARGKGVGRQLIKECVEGLKAAGIKRALILVEKENWGGRAFWISQGFEPIADAMALGRDFS